MENIFKHVKGNTYYWPSKTNIGLIIDRGNVILIDSGNDKDAGRKIRQYLDANNLVLTHILNTHSNADHIGANNYLLKQYINAKAYCNKRELFFIKYPELEACFLYGGFATTAMKNKFLMAKTSPVHSLSDLSYNIRYYQLDGHFFDMIAYHTSDDVIFLGDSLFSKDIIDKYHIFYILDVRSYLLSLDYLENLNKEKKYLFIPSHGILTNDISSIIHVNRNKVNEIIKLLLDILKEPLYFDLILKKVLDYYSLNLDLNQYLLTGSTIRNYLSYLIEEKLIKMSFQDNIVQYQKNSI